MKKQHLFVVLEGIMGSGKTTLATMATGKLGGFYYNTPKSFRHMRPWADRHLSLVARYHFYLSLNAQVSSEVSQLLKDGPVFCDKYIWSTFCYHKALGLDITDFPKPNIIMPDFCFLILCEDTIRLDRISHRDPVADHSKDFERQETERRCLEEYRKVLPDAAVDNSQNDPRVALNKILTALS